MKTTEEEFDLFYIDMNRLEEQVAEHSFLFVQYNKELKRLKTKVAKAKANLDLVHAEITISIVKDPEKYKLPAKPTATLVSCRVLKHSKYKEALNIYHEVIEECDMMQVYVNAYDHRKRMLEEAVKLHGQSYFATPYIASSDIKEVVDQLRKRKIRGRKSKSK